MLTGDLLLSIGIQRDGRNQPGEAPESCPKLSDLKSNSHCSIITISLKIRRKFFKKRKKNLTDVSADSFNVVIVNNALFFKIHFCSHFSGFLYKNANKICTGTDATPIIV